jgi:class 3 adenylate cyclase/TolB-like protein
MTSLPTSRTSGPQRPHPQRRQAAILIADMVGYSRLMEANEDLTHAWMMRLRSETLDPGIEEYGGRTVKNTGDGFVALFDSARDAVACARALQQTVTAQTAHQPPEQRILFRMAVNAADVIVEEDDVYGDGVNVAARLQSYAEPGGITISSAAAEQAGDAVGRGLIDLGDLPLRNMARPVRVFALRPQIAPSRLVGDVQVGSEPRPSLAVLPFRMHQTTPEESYFADGIVDDIIHALASLKELFVVSRGSTLGYGGAAVDVHAIGADLGVRYVLYGSVRRSGGRLRIGTELSDAETGTVIRADQYEGSLTDLFELQGRIAVSVLRMIAPHVQERELVRAMRKQPQNMTAYDLVLQAIDVLYRLDYESFSRARGLLQRAIAHDPGYAPAYAYTAYWYMFRFAETTSSDPDADIAAAMAHASVALEHGGDDPLALAIYGHGRSFLLKDYDTALTYLDRAIEVGPSSAMVWTMSSCTRGYISDTHTAVQHAEQGVRLAPLDARLFWHEGILGQAHYIDGDYDQAFEWSRSAFERNESRRANLRTMIATLVALGRKKEAAEAARVLMSLEPKFRLGSYAERCPFPTGLLEPWLARLRSAGLPE